MAYLNSDVWNDAFLDSMRLQADPAADDVIASVIKEKGPEEAKRIFDLLIHSINLPLEKLPAQVSDFILKHNQLPFWADSNLIRRGEEFFQDNGPSMLVILFYKSLPLLYTNAKGAKVLTGTGRLSYDPNSDTKFSRRIAETGQFLLDVMDTGGLDPGGKGIETILRIRLIHASIRAFISFGNTWDAAKLGKPINQEDLGTTLMTFSVCLLDGLCQFGGVVREADEIAFFHCWKVVGHFLGIHPTMIPVDAASGRDLLDKALQRHAEKSEDGIILTDAIVQFVEKAIPEKVFDQVPAIMIRFLCGEKYAEMLNVNVKLGCLSIFLPKFIRLWMGVIKKLEEKNESIREISDKIAMALLTGMVGYFNKEKGRSFTISEGLRKKWGL